MKTQISTENPKKAPTADKIVVAGLTVGLVMASCSRGQFTGDLLASPTPSVSASASPSATPSAAASSSASTTDVKKIVSTGPGLNFNQQTGGPSEIRLHPTTKLPAVVYYDRSALAGAGAGGSTIGGALKYAYMDSYGNWTIEIVDANYGTLACGSGGTCVGAQNVAAPTTYPQILDFQFTAGVNSTTPKPIIAYAYGTNAATAKYIRVAERNMTSGAWTISQPATIPSGIVATATMEWPIKGVRLLIDGSDRPHIYAGVYATTYTSSGLYYTMRKSDSSWTTFASISVPGMTFVSGGTLGATTGVLEAGAAICPATGRAVLSYPAGDNSPATSNEPYVIFCTASDANGTCSTWQAINLAAGCGGGCFSSMTSATTNAGQRSDLAIAPATNKIIFGMYSTAVPATSAVAAIQGGADNCVTFSTTAWTAQAHPQLTHGTNGVRMTASTANAFMWGVSSTTNAVIAATDSGLASAWGTNTLTLDSNSPINTGGIAHDSTSDLVWGSYSIIINAAAGAAGNDLKVFSAYPADVVNTGLVNSVVVDQTNTIFPSTAVPTLAAAKAPNGTFGYAYFFTEQGTAGPNSHLYYGFRGGTTSAPIFGERLVFNSVQGAGANLLGQYPSMAYDSSSNPVIAFVDAGTTAPASTSALMIARTSNGGTYFTVDRVDGITTTPTVGRFNSVDVGSSDTLGVSYYDHTGGNLRLKFARKLTSGAWRRYIPDGLAGSANTNGCGTSAGALTDAGSYTSMKWTSTGRPVIAYQATIGAVKYLRLAYATEATSSSTYTWTCLTLDSSGQGSNARGEGIELFLDSNDSPHIVHMDSTQGAVRYVNCTSAVGTCVSTGATAFSAERIALTGSIVAGSARPSIRTTSAGKRFATYYSAADQSLILAAKGASDSSWSTEVIETPPSGATFVSPAGQYGVLLLNASELPLVFYRSIENWIKYFSRESS